MHNTVSSPQDLLKEIAIPRAHSIMMPFQLSLNEGRFLIRLARRAVKQYLSTGTKLPLPQKISSKFKDKYGVFVTLNHFTPGKCQLRGCIGFPYPEKSLIQAVMESAIHSATQDPRFHPLSLEELDHVIFEISVLTPPQIIQVDTPTKYPSQIQVGQDGLIIEKGRYKGLLLPQVPIEWKWKEDEFLSQCCLKAGLTPDCWLMKETKIFKFSCILVQETTPKGDVTLIDMRTPSTP